MMPPEAKDKRTAMFIAQIRGRVRESPKRAKFRLTGEKEASTKAGLPMVKLHQGINHEMAMSTRVAEPPAKPTQLNLPSIWSPTE